MSVGRKTKYGPQIVSEICKWIGEGNTARDACKLVGIHEDTFYTWKKGKPEFSEALSAAEAQCKASCIKRVLEAGERDWRASAWILERRHKREYAKMDISQQEIKQTVDIVSAVSAAKELASQAASTDIDEF